MQIPDNDTLTKYDPYIEPGDGAWDQYLEDMYEDRMLAEDEAMAEYLEDYED